MENLRQGIDANGMTGLQAEWGGTHDALLGLFIWIHSIPQYSMHQHYKEDGIEVYTQNGKIIKVLDKGWENQTVIHKIRDLKVGAGAKNVKLIGFHDLELLMHVNYNQTTPHSELPQYHNYEFNLGVEAAKALTLFTQSYLDEISFNNSKGRPFKVFGERDCPKRNE